jgi:hypothetical protein
VAAHRSSLGTTAGDFGLSGGPEKAPLHPFPPGTSRSRQKLDDERYPLAPRLDPLKAILAKLEPLLPRPPFPLPLRPGKLA